LVTPRAALLIADFWDPLLRFPQQSVDAPETHRLGDLVQCDVCGDVVAFGYPTRCRGCARYSSCRRTPTISDGCLRRCNGDFHDPSSVRRTARA